MRFPSGDVGRNHSVGGQREQVDPPYPLSLITAPLMTGREQADRSWIEIDKQDNKMKWKHGGLRALTALKRRIKKSSEEEAVPFLTSGTFSLDGR